MSRAMTNPPPSLPPFSQTTAAPSASRRMVMLALFSLLAALVAGALQIGFGSYGSSWRAMQHAVADTNFWSHPATLVRLAAGDAFADRLGLAAAVPLDTATLIVWNVRVPRVLVALLVGMDLAVGGSIFQAITRNELASPYTLGVSAGAGLAVLLVLVVFPGLGPHLPLIASAGGALAFLIVYAIAWKGGTSSVRLVLAGVIVGSVAASVQTALHLFIRDLGTMQDATAWLSGSLTGAGWTQVRYALPWTILVVVLSLCSTRWMDVLLLGDARAKSLGMAVERVRFGLAVVAILAAGTVVSVAGLVGFVGLIVPHIVRSIVGSTSRAVILGGLVAGPALMLTADAIARLAFRPMQLPVGLVTGTVGGVWFLVLMRRKARLQRP